MLIMRRTADAAPEACKEGMLEYLEGKIAKWWTPDAVIVLDEALPLQATGKVYKLKLREMFNAGLFDDQLKGTSVERS